ncbi:hypothetical protein BKA69DRAFT_1102492 [Paraphysoderma sedebokerense]|nr:hypothetical protein BKA69DRAFT_1105196 [Paraphysoderma sedebokerense]KAI9136672.1 hypothetical protein BKA69DRAFT_1102492 [Paraphysoderma sedebokerense]
MIAFSLTFTNSSSLLNTLFQILYLFASSSSAPSHSTSTSPSSLSPHLLALLQNVFVPLATWKAGPHNTVTRLRCFQCLEVLFGCFEPTSFALSSSAVSLSLTSLSGLSVPPVPKLSFASSDKSEANLTLNCLITTDSFEHEYEINGKKESLRKRFLKVLIGSIEDDEAITRVACLRVLKKWFELEIENGQASFDENHLKEVYPEVLSRLDDSLDAIRIQACRTLIGLLTYLKKNEEKLKLDDVHGKEITKMVVVHVDDTREDVANAACDVLATTSLVYPQIVKDYLNSVRVKYRNKGMIEKLVSEIVV